MLLRGEREKKKVKKYINNATKLCFKNGFKFFDHIDNTFYCFSTDDLVFCFIFIKKKILLSYIPSFIGSQIYRPDLTKLMLSSFFFFFFFLEFY